MLATQRMSPPNSVFAGNQAGAPLPLIPRRLSRESSSSSSLPVKVVIQHSSPPLPLDDSGSSSSSDSGRPTVSIRAKRVCPEQPPQNDTTPRRAPLLYSPGVTLRPTTARNFSESHAQTSASSGSSSLEPPSPSTISVSQSQPRLIRKKSGQLVKSSLKPSKSLSLLTPCSPYSHSRSAPDTPLHTPKNVHFDAQLEHVKLFLAEQKPLAVSRDGSPTEDTASGTDTDFPDWVFGTSSSPSTRKLIMHHVNRAPRLSANTNDVVLESLELSPDAPSVVGRVRVSNLAYTKSVVARFTFDAWQTTSEVSARYVSSPSPRTDIFVFSVRLNDLMARIDGKRMCLAMRYTVGGREIWDNNGGDDYLVEFGLESKSKDSERELVLDREREKEREREREDRSRRPTPDPTAIASLRSTLEKVVAPSPVPRYDFSQSLSSRWVPPSLLHTPVPQDSPNSAPSHAQVRTQSYPSPGTTPRPKSHANSNSNSIPWPRGVKEREKEKCQWTPPLGSPRDVSDEDRPLFAGVKYTRNDAGTENLSFPPNACTHTPTPTPRRHHRRGYFDVHHPNANGSVSGKGSGVRRTPPGSPPVGLVSESDDEESGSDEGEGEKTPMPGRCYSFPPTSTRTRTGMGSGGTAGLGFFANSDARDAHGHSGLGRAAAGVGAGVALGQGVGIGMRIGMGIDAGVRMGEDSELSTPSFGSSRATSPSPSPSPSPTESELSTETDDTETETETETECEGGGRYKRIGANDSNGSYKEFLSRFCFFTGTATATGVGIFPDSSDSPPHALPLDSSHSSHSSHIRAHTYPHAQKRFIVPRTQSASEIIESPRPLLPLQERAMAVRSPSFDDVLLGSGAATPVGELSPPTMVQLCDARRVTPVLPASCLPCP